MSHESFGARLKELRRKHGLKSTELATELGISLPHLSQMEADLAVPSEELARRVAKRFKQDEEELVFLARRMPKQLKEIVEKFPTAAPAYWRRIMKEKK